jgi:hypothetical protein
LSHNIILIPHTSIVYNVEIFKFFKLQQLR